MKFLPEIFVASEEGMVLSLLWLSQDGSRRDCWKIDEIIINPETDSSLAVTKQLLQYGLSQLGAQGVETFLAYLDVSSTDGINLMKECGFRRCTRSMSWRLEASDLGIIERQEDIEKQLKQVGLREATGWDIKQLQSLYEDSLPPEIRVSLRRLPTELHPSLDRQFLERCKGSFHKAWVLPHSSQQYLLAYVSIHSHDFREFKLQVIVSPGYDHDLESIVWFGLNQIYKNGSKITVNIDSYEFQKTLQAVIETAQFQLTAQTEILVKDVFVPMSNQGNKLTSPILLFGKQDGKTSPA